MYRLYRIQYTYVVCVCEECSVFAIHYKYIVEGLRKTIRRAKIIDHSFSGKSYRVCYRLSKNSARGSSLKIFYTFILNKI